INIVIAGVSILVGILARSSAIIADGLHTCADLASDFTVLWGIKAAKRPADDCHHYGHARYEAMTAMFVGLLLFGAAVFVAAQSIMTFGERHGAPMSWIPFWTAVAAIVLKEGMYRWTRAVGRKFRNQALIASAWHHRSDAFSSVAAAAGIGGAVVGGPRWAFLDHLTAVVLAAFLVVIGVRIVRDALQRLADRAPKPEVLEKVRAVITGIPGVRGFHSFRARHSGAGEFIEMDVHVQVDPGITVQQGHAIATQVEEGVRAALPDVTSAVVHIEPPEST
ncbi:cation transporter, partial [candidate division WOR-3 bacterium]|nr:cation transporter [candidate division WOR-3 bacterium]